MNKEADKAAEWLGLESQKKKRVVTQRNREMMVRLIEFTAPHRVVCNWFILA